jgi:hypothetical protein
MSGDKFDPGTSLGAGPRVGARTCVLLGSHHVISARAGTRLHQHPALATLAVETSDNKR